MQREELCNVLEREIPEHRLTLVTAPAGYGKTSLIAEWVRNTTCTVIWLSLDEMDNDFELFFRYWVTAWRASEPSIEESGLNLLVGSVSPDHEAVTAEFVNLADELAGDVVFVLDDFHVIQDQSILEALTSILDNAPPSIHVVLLGREQPSLPVARYRARGQVFEVTFEDLQFSIEETTRLLTLLTGHHVDQQRIETLRDHTEGWVAGLQLAGLAMRSNSGSQEHLEISGRHRFIADYLNQEIFRQLDDDIQTFLVQTGILAQLCGSLCDAVTGRDNSQSVLELLERECLFLIPLDDRREWFRYHGLFADFLKGELSRWDVDEVGRLHRQAGRWFFEQGLADEAFEHAVDGNDPNLALAIFERYLQLKVNTGEIAGVVRWVEALPPDWYASHPIFHLFRGVTSVFAGDFPGCMRCLELAEEGVKESVESDSSWQLAIITSVRCFIACMQNNLPAAEELAEAALQHLRDESRGFRAGIYHALGDTYRRHGLWQQAQACYYKVPGEIIGFPGFEIQAAMHAVHINGALADLELEKGKLRNAAEYWRKAHDALRSPDTWGRLELPVAGWVLIRSAEVAFEWNDLDTVEEHLGRGMRSAELSGDARTRIAAHLLRCRLRLATGDVDAAQHHLEAARPLIEQGQFPDWIGRFERTQIECWLAQGRLRAAVNWADEMLEGNALVSHPDSDAARITTARVLVVKGDAPALQQALRLLGTALESASTKGRIGIRVEALALQALVHWRFNDTARALTSLERALRLAESEGFQRLFVDLGSTMQQLLREARSRQVMRNYVDTLLTAFGSLVEDSAGHQALQPEPLTDREQEILELIAGGLTNAEIAERLFISPETVKKHAGSIYAKLGVHSRTEAALRARELALLS